MSDYRVNLDIYNGPLDLLLYLIRREEVDIYDIPIAGITEQYVQYVEVIKALDPNLAGEFLVMAASLMEIKSRMLLPIAKSEDSEEDEELEIDPRAELVRQLLEYKAFKDAAGELQDAAALQSLKFPRHPVLPEKPGEPELDLEDVQVWDLLDAFDEMMASIGQKDRQHEVIYDDTPIELHAADIVDRLQRDGAMSFEQIFEGRQSRSEVVGLFLALLELVRQKKILTSQEENFRTIHVHLNPNPPDPDAEPEDDESFDDELKDDPAEAETDEPDSSDPTESWDDDSEDDFDIDEDEDSDDEDWDDDDWDDEDDVDSFDEEDDDEDSDGRYIPVKGSQEDDSDEPTPPTSG